MTLKIAAITFDCAHATNLATFWSAALDRPIDPGDPNAAEHFASIGRENPTPGEPVFLFLQVPEPKTAKNRTHLDLDASDREAEIERLVGLGATVVHEKNEWGISWTTLADPEGNEFCVAEH